MSPLQQHVVSFSYFRVKSGGIFDISHMDILSLLWRHAAFTRDRIHQPGPLRWTLVNLSGTNMDVKVELSPSLRGQ